MKKSAVLAVWGLALACCAPVNAQLLPYQLDMPLLKPAEFAPGVISTDAFEINVVLNQQGDNVIFARCDDDFANCVLMESDFRDGQWQTPQTLPFSGEFQDADPYYSPDYQNLYFISKRPIAKGTNPTESYNLWRVSKTLKGWGKPEYFSGLNSGAHDLYPSLDDAGNLYFPSLRNDQRHLYMAKPSHFGFAQPQPLPDHIYGENGKTGDAAVSRNGKMIIFSIRGRADSKGNGDLYVSRLINNRWTVAESLGDRVNTPDHEFTPIISPDNKYLFFTRIEKGIGNLYQIDLGTLGVSLEMDTGGELLFRQQALDAAAQGATLAGIPLTADWQKRLYHLSASTMQHPGWGMSHSERNYLTTLDLAEKEQVTVDTDVLFAAAFMHDIAAFDPWKKAGVDHSTRASDLAPSMLTDLGFPTEKIPHVQQLIMAHMYYSETGDDVLAQLFHDADTLDFLGVTGIARILGVNGQSGVASNTAKAIETLEGFMRDLPATLSSKTAQRRGKAQAEEMKRFLDKLKADTAGFSAP